MSTTPSRNANEGTEHLKQAAHVAADGFRKAAESLKVATSHATEELSEAGAAAARGAQDLWDQAGDAIRKHPVAAAGIAFAAGVVLSRLLRR